MEEMERKLIKQKLKSSKIGKPSTRFWKPSSTYISNFEFVVNNDIYFIEQLYSYA